MVEYVVDLKEGYSCTVKVSRVNITSVFSGLSLDEVMTRATHIVVRLLTTN
jgi:hypothetical protein